MSGAFVREEDAQWLHDIPPTMNALIRFLTQENNGIRVYEKKSYKHPQTDKDVHEMSNGFCYSIGADSKWYVVE